MVDRGHRFNWGDIIELDIKDPQFRAQVIASLDQIALTPEGRDLLQKAHANVVASRDLFRKGKADPSIPAPRADGKIEIADHANIPQLASMKSSTLPMLGYINLDVTQIGRIGFSRQTDDGWQVMNLTHVLVHELVHQADPHMQLAHGSKFVVAPLLQFGRMIDGLVAMPSVQGNDAMRLKGNIVQKAMDLLIEQHWPETKGMSPAQRQTFLTSPDHVKEYMPLVLSAFEKPELLAPFAPQVAQQLGIAADSFHFQKVDFKKIQQEDTTLDPMTHTQIVEEIATQFTDYFMGKYFNEAPRIVYRRAHDLPAAAQRPVEVYPFHCGPKNIQLHYRNVEPDMLGLMPHAFPQTCQSVLAQLKPAR